jgi:hypothetical protein
VSRALFGVLLVARGSRRDPTSGESSFIAFFRNCAFAISATWQATAVLIPTEQSKRGTKRCDVVRCDPFFRAYLGWNYYDEFDRSSCLHRTVIAVDDVPLLHTASFLCPSPGRGKKIKHEALLTQLLCSRAKQDRAPIFPRRG